MNDNDYQLMANLISVASSRGAFRADELYDIGALYNRLIKHIEALKSMPTDATQIKT